MKKITENIDLKEIEKKTWRSTLEDGILEIYFGILVLGLGMGITLIDILPNLLDKTISFIFIGIGLMFFILAKKYISQPHLGVVKFGLKRKSRKLKTIVVLSINSIILLIIYLIGFINPDFRLRFPAYLDGLIIGLLFVSVPLCFVAYFLQFTRLYVYALLLGCGFYLADSSSIIIPIPFNFLITYLLLGGFIILVGIIYLIRFVRKYQLPQEEVNRDG